MKKNVVISSIVATVFAFGLYSWNIERVNNAQVNVIEPKNKVNKTKNIIKKKTSEPKKTKEKEPKIDSVEYSNHVKIAKGSQKTLANKIKSVMGIDNSYQVAVQDLTNSSKFVRVANTSKTHSAGSIMKMYILIGLFEQEQKGKIGSKTAIKISKSDQVSGEKALKTGMSYGVLYLRQAMMRGSKTAANALIRKIGQSNIDAVAKKLGANQITISKNFNKEPYGKITAADLTQTMVGVYQGRALNRIYASRFLTSLSTNSTKTPLVKNLKSASYSIGDDTSAVAIVQGRNHAYAVSIWSENNKKFAELGETVYKYFAK